MFISFQGKQKLGMCIFWGKYLNVLFRLKMPNVQLITVLVSFIFPGGAMPIQKWGVRKCREMIASLKHWDWFIKMNVCGVCCCALLALRDVYSLIFRPRVEQSSNKLLLSLQLQQVAAANSANNSQQISSAAAVVESGQNSILESWRCIERDYQRCCTL